MQKHSYPETHPMSEQEPGFGKVRMAKTAIQIFLTTVLPKVAIHYGISELEIKRITIAVLVLLPDEQKFF